MLYPKKPAPADYPINEVIRQRWSPRVFSDKLLAAEKLKSLFEAARYP